MVCISYGKCVKVLFVGFFIKGVSKEPAHWDAGSAAALTD